MRKSLVSKLADADMKSAPKALLRAARRAREIARQTRTPFVVVRDGQLIQEQIRTDDTVDSDEAPFTELRERSGGAGRPRP